MEPIQIEFSVLGMEIVMSIVQIELIIFGLIFLATFIGHCIYFFVKGSWKEKITQSLGTSFLVILVLFVIFAVLLVIGVLPNTW